MKVLSVFVLSVACCLAAPSFEAYGGYSAPHVAYSPAPAYSAPAYSAYSAPSYSSYSPVPAYSPAPAYTAAPSYSAPMQSYAPSYHAPMPTYGPAPMPAYGHPHYRSNELDADPVEETMARSAYDLQPVPAMPNYLPTMPVGYGHSHVYSAGSAPASAEQQYGVFPATASRCAVPLLVSCSPSVVQGSIQPSYHAYPSYSAPSYVAPAVMSHSYRETEDVNKMHKSPVEIEAKPADGQMPSQQQAKKPQ